ncbi:MAG: hypothetical protein ACFFAN_12135 [Promethearchaeota archaeon]
MQLQGLDWSRIIPIFFTQLFIAIVFFYLAYKVLKRHRTRISIICSLIFIPIATAFIVNIIYLFLRVNPAVYILYLFAIYLLLLAQIFILLFNLNLLKSKFEFTSKKQSILFILYSIVFFLILLFPNGIKIDETTDWRPLWNIYFSIILMIISAICFVIPSTIFSIRIYKAFEDDLVKKKWGYYLLGYVGLAFTFYSLIFYNTISDPLIRTIASLLTLILVPSGVLMYLGIGRQLQK